jgi:hypothetical protein
MTGADFIAMTNDGSILTTEVVEKARRIKFSPTQYRSLQAEFFQRQALAKTKTI